MVCCGYDYNHADHTEGPCANLIPRTCHNMRWSATDVLVAYFSTKLAICKESSLTLQACIDTQDRLQDITTTINSIVNVGGIITFRGLTLMTDPSTLSVNTIYQKLCLGSGTVPIFTQIANFKIAFGQQVST